MMDNKIIYVQWSNGFGGLEKISQLYEDVFRDLNPLILPLRFVEEGICYNNLYELKSKDRFFFIFEYFHFVKKRKKCIYHLQYTRSLILLITYLAGGRKLIYHFHGTKFSNNIFDKIVWKLVGSKIKVIANSVHTKQVIKKEINLRKGISVIPNLISTSNFVFTKRKYDENKFVVTYAGRFSKGKNIGLLLKTIKQIEEYGKIEGFEFRLYGEGTEKSNIMYKIDELGLRKFVKIFPFEKNVNKIYQESNLFIFLSLYESFGNVVAEAILTGLPIICYRIPSLQEFINDDIFFVNELDSKLIAEKVIRFKKNYSEILERVEFAYRFTLRYLDNERIIKQLNKIYEEMID